MSRNRDYDLSNDLEAELLSAIRPENVAPDLSSRLKTRVMAKIRRASIDDTFTLPSHEGEWITIAPKADMKLLRQDTTSRSFLLRLSSGAELPAHGHPV